MTEDLEPEYVVDKETAEAEFRRFCHAMDIDDDTNDMDEEDAESFRHQKKQVVRAIRKGTLSFNNNGEAVYAPVSEKVQVLDGQIVFHEPTGADKMEVDKHKEGQNAHKMYAMLASVTKQPQKVYANMNQRDLKVCEALFALLFMG